VTFVCQTIPLIIPPAPFSLMETNRVCFVDSECVGSPFFPEYSPAPCLPIDEFKGCLRSHLSVSVFDTLPDFLRFFPSRRNLPQTPPLLSNGLLLDSRFPSTCCTAYGGRSVVFVDALQKIPLSSPYGIPTIPQRTFVSPIRTLLFLLFPRPSFFFALKETVDPYATNVRVFFFPPSFCSSR